MLPNYLIAPPVDLLPIVFLVVFLELDIGSSSIPLKLILGPISQKQLSVKPSFAMPYFKPTERYIVLMATITVDRIVDL